MHRTMLVTSGVLWKWMVFFKSFPEKFAMGSKSRCEFVVPTKDFDKDSCIETIKMLIVTDNWDVEREEI